MKGSESMRIAAWGSLLLLVWLAGCRTVDDARVLQSLNQRGFGRRYIGNSNEILTIGVGDSIRIQDMTNEDILGTYVVRMDGVITVPLIGEVFIAGFSTNEIAEALNQRYSEFYNDVDIQVFVENIGSKNYFVRGEVFEVGARPFFGNTTVWDAIMASGVPVTADLSDIYVIRADPYHPLIIPVDMRKMLRHGDARDNVLLREDDIVVVNPNFAGILTNIVEFLIAPVQPVAQLASGVQQVQFSYDRIQTGSNFGGGFGTTGTFNNQFNSGNNQFNSGNNQFQNTTGQ